MINFKNSDSNLLKVDKKSYKNIDIYYFGYITMKDVDSVNIHSVNLLYFIIDKADGCIEERNRNKYLTLFSNDKNKDILKMYTELWDQIKNIIESITNTSGDYD